MRFVENPIALIGSEDALVKLECKYYYKTNDVWKTTKYIIVPRGFYTKVCNNISAKRKIQSRMAINQAIKAFFKVSSHRDYVVINAEAIECY